MTDLIGQLAARTLQLTPVVQPRLASLFAEVPHPREIQVTPPDQAILPVEDDAEPLNPALDARPHLPAHRLHAPPLVPANSPVLDLAALPRFTFPQPAIRDRAVDFSHHPSEENHVTTPPPPPSLPQAAPATIATPENSPQAPKPLAPLASENIPGIVPTAHSSPPAIRIPSISSLIHPIVPSSLASVQQVTSTDDVQSRESVHLSSTLADSDSSTSIPSSSAFRVDSSSSSVASPLVAIGQPASVHTPLQPPHPEIVQPNLSVPAVMSQNDAIAEEIRNRDRANNTPVIRVTIGRIDVRAIPAAPPPRAQPQPNPKPQLSLADYLKSRNGGNR
ncbi:MAG TPA: hypothetical protein V6C65_00615 [Allocoleopsis sp.]